MIRIIVSKTAIRDLKGNAKNTGKPYHLRIQEAYAFTVDADGNSDPFPEKFEMMLDADQAPYAPGEYVLHPSSLYMSRDGKLSVSPRLAPVKAARPATATA
jgi:hypothetical protein